MTLHRFFASGPVPDAGQLPLSASDVHHIRDVLRLGPGDRVLLADETGAAVVRLTAVGEAASGVRERTMALTSVPRVVLAQGVAKGDRMDAVIRQATEIGVSRVIPFTSERCVVRLDAVKAHTKAERWRRVAAEAAKQCQRADVPDVADVVPLAQVPALLEGAAVLACWEEADQAPGVGQALREFELGPESEVAVVVGPEGGLASGEVALLRESGARVVTLGTTVLRTETAGVLAACLALYEQGGLGGRRD